MKVKDSFMKKGAGFTIVELMLATAVFSVTLLIALNGFLQIGRLFYKGVSNTQTQSIARQVLNDLSRNVQLSPEVSAQLSSPASGPGNYHYYCVGSNRYTYTTRSSGQAVAVDLNGTQNLSAGDNANFGLIRDTLPGSSGCAAPCVSSCPAPFNNPQEMLGNKMRIGKLQICSPLSTTPGCPSNSPENVYNITVMVIYGDDDTLDYSGGPSNPDTASCKGGSTNQFCSVDTLSTGVYKGIDI